MYESILRGFSSSTKISLGVKENSSVYTIPGEIAAVDTPRAPKLAN